MSFLLRNALLVFLRVCGLMRAWVAARSHVGVAGLSIEFEKGLSIMTVGLGGWGPDSRPVTCDCGRPKGDARLAARDLGCTKQPADEALVR